MCIDGQRASARRFGDRRVQSLFAALLRFDVLPQGFRNRELRETVAALCGALARRLAEAYGETTDVRLRCDQLAGRLRDGRSNQRLPRSGLVQRGLWDTVRTRIRSAGRALHLVDDPRRLGHRLVDTSPHVDRLVVKEDPALGRLRGPGSLVAGLLDEAAERLDGGVQGPVAPPATSRLMVAGGTGGGGPAMAQTGARRRPSARCNARFQARAVRGSSRRRTDP